MSATLAVIDNRIPALLTALPTATRALLQEAAERYKDTARALAPVRTGAFRDGIQVDDGGPDDLFVVFTAPHSYFVLFGTARMGARPVHQWALDQVGPWYLNEVGRLYQRAGL